MTARDGMQVLGCLAGGGGLSCVPLSMAQFGDGFGDGFGEPGKPCHQSHERQRAAVID